MSEERGKDPVVRLCGTTAGGRFGGEPAGEGPGHDEQAADCEETIRRLYHFLDGELTEERRRAISAHLDRCGQCLEAADFEAELRRVVADRCKDRVPDSLRTRIAEALGGDQRGAGLGTN